MRMWVYIVRRAVLVFPVFVGVLTVLFVLVSTLPEVDRTCAFYPSTAPNPSPLPVSSSARRDDSLLGHDPLSLEPRPDLSEPNVPVGCQRIRTRSTDLCPMGHLRREWAHLSMGGTSVRLTS